MDIYGLVGYPLGHSFSRAFFTDKFEREGIDAQYLNFEIPAIADLPKVLKTKGLRGFNVTIPYKQQVIPYLDSLSTEAESIGAVNVVMVREDGTLKGYNSDVYGFVESIKPLLTATQHRKALVLGTGGASRAVSYGLESLGLEVNGVSRSPGTARYAYADLTPETVAAHTVIVNTTPLGMYPKVDAAPEIPYEGITPAHVCYDVVYNPAETLFLLKCAEHGARVLGGLEMLRLQAIRAWDIWQEGR